MNKPTEIAYVTWVDSIGIEGWTTDLPRETIEHSAVGWLLEETEKSIVLSASFGAPSWEGYSFHGPIRIPRLGITRIEKHKAPAWLVNAC